MRGAPNEGRARVVLADDHALVRDGVRKILEADGRFVIVAEASTGPGLVEVMVAGGVDLLVSDVVMPQATGLQALRSLRSRRIDVPAIFLTSSTKEYHLREAVALDARAYLHKSVGSAEFLQACLRVLDGKCLLSPDKVASMLARWRADEYGAGARFGRPALTAREEDVVRLVADGLPNNAIAERLYLSVKTVEHHRANILTKLDLHSGVDLCRYAIRTGLVEA